MDFDNFDVFGEKAAVADADRVLLIEPEQIYPDPDNVRREIDPITIDEMAETISERGQLQPITVAPKDEEGRYRILFGERRWRACQKLGIKVRAIVSKSDDLSQVRIDQFIENDQREDLSTADMIAFVTGQVAQGRNLSELARLTGRNRTLLTRYQGLAKAPDYISALFSDISMRSAVALAQAAKKDDAATRSFVSSTSAEDMTVLACERFARDVGAKKTATPASPSAEPAADVEQLDTSESAQLVEDATESEVPLSTEEIRDAEVERAIESAPSLTVEASSPSPAPARTGKSKPAKQKVERPTIEIGGQRAIVVEALLHFDGEEAPRIVSWR
ncbi:ParB/RepB/Spo0J family partition protein [Sphingobium yanoikuyae]|uniref:ParB/RepB/Spo0J family partition protein n=1 Tax=Sphingobium yanoikuyae TaxID=13690 RepID=A0A430BKP6_SPHYA|nr:ParB/RepB/Spo0J family partition protein [Sphingobium yanoikuyae]RSU52223.1 ParB/RepB/Spo0J family partition protein [Sphingobium yanoikuyae]